MGTLEGGNEGAELGKTARMKVKKLGKKETNLEIRNLKKGEA